MFSSNKKRHLSVLHVVGIYVLGTFNGTAEFSTSILPRFLHFHHFSGMVVIIGKRLIDVSDVQIVAVGNRLWILPAPLYKGVYLADRDSPAADVWFAQELVSDSFRSSLGHTDFYLARGKNVQLISCIAIPPGITPDEGSRENTDLCGYVIVYGISLFCWRHVVEFRDNPILYIRIKLREMVPRGRVCGT